MYFCCTSSSYLEEGHPSHGVSHETGSLLRAASDNLAFDAVTQGTGSFMVLEPPDNKPEARDLFCHENMPVMSSIPEPTKMVSVLTNVTSMDEPPKSEILTMI